MAHKHKLFSKQSSSPRGDSQSRGFGLDSCLASIDFGSWEDEKGKHTVGAERANFNHMQASERSALSR